MEEILTNLIKDQIQEQFGDIASGLSIQLHPRYLTTQQVAVYLTISKRTVHNYCKKGRLNPIMLEGTKRFDKMDIDEMMEQLKEFSN